MSSAPAHRATAGCVPRRAGRSAAHGRAPRHELADTERNRIAPLLPPRETRGTYYRDHRTVLNGMLHWHATGLPWRDLPERYGPWQTV